MTPEQKQDAERLRRYIEREQLGAVMSATKWREAVQALQAIPGFVVRFRVKTVRGPEPPAGYWEGSFPWHLPQPYANIEWLDIHPVVRRPRGLLVPDEVTDFTEQVTCALRAVNVPFVQQGQIIRIQGYVRPPAT
jgi:hypothetical protein